MIRRRTLPPELVPVELAFHAMLDQVEPAKAGLADVLPGTRMPGRPLSDALEEFEAALVRARHLMAEWRAPEVEEAWEATDRGLAEALERTRRARERDRDPEGFEALLGLVESLLDPLDPLSVAEAAFRGLRRR